LNKSDYRVFVQAIKEERIKAVDEEEAVTLETAPDKG
jgi:hypothetical protein